jgi:hypothetical protein
MSKKKGRLPSTRVKFRSKKSCPGYWKGRVKTRSADGYNYSEYNIGCRVGCKKICSVVQCKHERTHSMNLEGHAGIWCMDCHEKLKDEC